MSLTRALTERGTVIVDAYANQTHDLAFYEGHYYVAKPPGLAFTVAPFWWLFDQIHNDLNFVWRVTTFLFASLPGATSILVFYLILIHLEGTQRFALIASMVVAMGTGIFSYSTLFLEVPLVVLSLLTALLILLRPKGRMPQALLVGLLIGYAVVLHYVVSLCVIPIAVFIGLRAERIRHILPFLLGLAIPLIAVPVYNYLCFSNPLLFGHFRSAVPQFQQHHEEIIARLMVPRLEALWGLTFSASKGLFVFSPFLVLTVVGLIIMCRRPSLRPHALLYSGIFGTTFVLVSSLPNWQGGMLSGPRYLLPVVPVLAIGILGLDCVNPSKWRTVVASMLVLSAAASIFIWATLTIVAPFSPEWLENPFVEKHLPDLIRGQIRPTVSSTFLGIGGLGALALAFAPTALLYGAAWNSSTRIPAFKPQ
jgi:hypothetical protein